MIRFGTAADRRSGRWLAGLAAIGVGLSALPTTAGAAGTTPTTPVKCPRYAIRAIAGRIGEIHYNRTTGRPDGATTLTGAPAQSAPYIAQTPVTLDLAGNHYVVERNTTFSLGCYGQSIHRPHILYPKLFVEHGVATVTTDAADPGAVQTFDALINPVGHVAQRITLQEDGTPTSTFMTMSSAGPIVDITPERGATAGHCIYHHAVKTHSTWDQRAQIFAMRVTVVS